MKKIKISQDKVLKKSKIIKVGKRRNMRIAAAEWVDEELIDNIKIRGKLSRRWRIARKGAFCSGPVSTGPNSLENGELFDDWPLRFVGVA